MPNNAIIRYAASADTRLSSTLLSLEQQFIAAAERNVEQAGSGFTQAQHHAMVVGEALKMVNGMDLAAVLMRGKFVRQIREEALFSVHPGGYQSMEEMARDQGISMSELSNVIDLNDTIFPYIEEHLGMSVAALWEQIGKSNFRELVPTLKCIITGEGTANTLNSVAYIMNDVAATAHATGQTLDESEIRETAFNRMLEAGTLPNRELRRQTRPERTPSINATYVVINGEVYIMAKLSEEQRTMVQRLLGNHMDPVQYDMPRDRNQRQREVSNIPVLGEIIREVI